MESSSSQPLLINLLLKKELIEEEGLEEMRDFQAKNPAGTEEALICSELIEEKTIAEVYSEFTKIPIVDLKENEEYFQNPDELKELLPEKFARENNVVPFQKKHNILKVALLDPTTITLLQEIQMVSGSTVDPYIGIFSEITEHLDLLYGARDVLKEIAVEAQTQQSGRSRAKDGDQVEEILDLDMPRREIHGNEVIIMVDQILKRAIDEGASDIHMEPFEKEVNIRLRIDGVLNPITPPPKHMYIPMISRLKILSKMDIAEKRVPQDGAFGIKISAHRIDVRVSTIPTVHGEKMVMRLLNKEAIPLDLTKLGFDRKQCDDFMDAANAPHGLLFVTGPTGSGKSTTLYATLNLLRSPKKNILTVEDPVEYKFTGINQVQVKQPVGLTFARALRAFLRQDPDIIMLGEVRDQETAEICIRAALTGHFVLSTLHTNDALSAIARLQDMGLEPFLLASTLRLLEAQRLIRRLCVECKEAYSLDQETAEKFELDPKGTYYRAKGCENCRDLGYKGRVGLFEVILITQALKDAIINRATLNELKKIAHKEGSQLLIDNGLNKVREGVTSLEEVVTITQD